MDTPRSDVTDPAEGLTPGLPSLSRTRSELTLRKARLRKKEALKFVPTKPLGVHLTSPPSYASRLGDTKEWYKDAARLAKDTKTPWDGSDLDGSRRLDETGAVASGGCFLRRLYSVVLFFCICC